MKINPQVPFFSDADLEELAESLLDQYEQEIEPIFEPPVPVEKIADFLLELNIEWLGIPDTEDEPILAYLLPSTQTIRLNERRMDYFDRFPGVYEYTIAHEIGHYHLHLAEGEDASDQNYICRYKQSAKDRREWQAERFASYLLMPESLLLPTIEDINLFHWPTLYQLRDQFRVSITALRIRLEAMGRLYVAPNGQLYPSQSLSTHDQRQAIHRLIGQGQLYSTIGQIARAKDAYHQALEIAKAAGFEREEASLSWNLGRLYADTDPDFAQTLMEVCLVYERKIDRAIAEADVSYINQLKAKQ